LADEVIIVDTGSEDDTVKLAKKLGAKVFQSNDWMHKAKARNLAMSKAKGDWIIVLDADETVEKPDELKQYLKKSEAQAIYIKLAYVDDAGNHTLSYQQMRIWKRGAYQYKYRAHELPVPVNGWGKLEYTDFVWEHRPPADRQWKLDYTLDRLLLDVKENLGDGRPIYYLARQYMYMCEWQDAIETTEKYLDMSKEGAIDRADAYANLAKCYSEIGDKEQQQSNLFKAIIEQPERRDWWAQLGEFFHNQGKDAVATGLLKTALSIPPPAHSYYNHYWYGSHIYDLIARSLWKQEKYNDGLEYAQKALELSPNDARLRNNLSFFESKIRLEKFKSVKPRNENKGLNILYWCRDDYAGVAHKTMSAIKKCTKHRAHSVTYVTNYLGYPKDILQPSDDELKELCNWADVIHVFDDTTDLIVGAGKPIVVTYNGSYYRTNRQELGWKHRDYVRLGTTLDLTLYGPKWMPVPIDDIGLQTNHTNGNYRISHAPVNRYLKDTDNVKEALGDLNLDIIEGVSNQACLERKAQSQVYIDQFLYGYGVNALEAWQMGIPVIANATDEILDLYLKHIGYLPFVQSNIKSLRETVQGLISDGKSYQVAVRRGKKFVKDFHSPEIVSSKLIDIYKTVL
jgi:glycosyltransferase involved in cell wall biosynthesis